MSSNRLLYDECAYKQRLDESVDPLSYLLNPLKYENCNKCRNVKGLVGGTNVSNIRGNLVDLENDLRGQTRTLSQCSSKKYNPNINNNIVYKGPSSNTLTEVDTTLQHLPPCQMFEFPAQVPNPKLKLDPCPMHTNNIVYNRHL